MWRGEESHEWGRRKDGPDSTERGTDTAAGEAPEYCRGFLLAPLQRGFKSYGTTEAAAIPGLSFTRRPRGAEQRDAVERQFFVFFFFSHRLQASVNKELKAKPSSGQPCGLCSARFGPCRQRKARLFSAMASYFSSGFYQSGSFPSRYHGPTGARGAGRAGVRGCRPRRAGRPGAGGEPPAAEANPPANLALTFLHLLLWQCRARLKFIAGCARQAQLQRDRTPRPPPSPSVS